MVIHIDNKHVEPLLEMLRNRIPEGEMTESHMAALEALERDMNRAKREAPYQFWLREQQA